MMWMPSKDEHVLHLLAHSSSRHLLEAFEETVTAMDLQWARTMLENGRPVGVAGVVWFVPNVLEAWAVFDEQALIHPLPLARDVKHWLAEAETELGAHRIQANVPACDPRADRWMRFLGFEFEGMLRKFSPLGEDRAMYARIPAWV